MDLPLPITMALTAVWMSLATAGVILLALGMRGRRTDYLPRCRACRYVIDLSVNPARCSECGSVLADTGIVRVGTKRFDEPKLVFGAMMVLTAAVVFAALLRPASTPIVAPVAQAVAPGNIRANLPAPPSADWLAVQQSRTATAAAMNEPVAPSDDAVTVPGGLLQQAAGHIRSMLASDAPVALPPDAPTPRQPQWPSAAGTLETFVSERAVESAEPPLLSDVTWTTAPTTGAYTINLPPLAVDPAPALATGRGPWASQPATTLKVDSLQPTAAPLHEPIRSRVRRPLQRADRPINRRR